MKLFLVTLIIFSTSAFSKVCQSSYEELDEYGWKNSYFCKNNVVRKLISTHIKSGNVTSKSIFDQYGRKEESRSWNMEGKETFHAKFEYPSKNISLKIVLSTLKESKGKTLEQNQYQRVGNEKFLVKSWVISKRSFKKTAIKHFKIGESRPYRIDVLSNNKVIKYYKVVYNLQNPYANLVYKFNLYDPNHNLIGSYDENKEFNINEILSTFNLSEEERSRRLNVFNNKNREPVVIIDTGFDISHQSIAHKLYNSPFDNPFDGIDNDGNGKVDDSWGWQRQDDPGIGLFRDDRNIKETHSLVHTPYPVSHGTHVAALAFKGLDSYGLVGFAGDVAIGDHLESASKFINNKKIRFVNMSFAIGYPGAVMSAPRESFYFLESLISSNPETLFVVAAGNSRGARDLDLPGNSNYPASYTYKNMLKVGAINSPSLKRNDYQNYKPAFFSKFGKTKVQIFAPGQGVVSAQSGGGTIAMNGTSMASPFVLNVILKASKINKSLTPSVLKKIVMDTAYIPASGRLPCESGGIIVPDRVYLVAKLLKTKNYNLLESIKLAKKSLRIKGESSLINQHN